MTHTSFHKCLLNTYYLSGRKCQNYLGGKVKNSRKNPKKKADPSREKRHFRHLHIVSTQENVEWKKVETIRITY